MDDDTPIELKFEDCKTCLHRCCAMTCMDCDSGEYYEEEDMPGVDSLFGD